MSDLMVDLMAAPRTALWHACTRVPVAAPAEKVSTVLVRMAGERYECASVIAVLDDGQLAGLAVIERMFGATEGTTLRDVMNPSPPVVTPDTHQEKAAWQAVEHGEPGLAVVGVDGQFHGLIAPQQLLAVLRQEHEEDLARLGGFLHSVESTRRTTVETVRRRLWHRLPWLLVGLVGAMVSAGMMAGFESTLESNVAVAYFVPGIVYLADAVGTQTETVAIRGLSVGIGIRRILRREALTGLSVGAFLAIVMLPVVSVMSGDAMLAAAVAIAVFAASAIATVVAMALPWLLHRLGKDPAFGSGPLATVIQDLLSIMIYFTAVVALVA
ncbi:magnesium transporter [Rhodococcus sp. T2V]|uniref:magnesium transporter n=1 Tax=Rhodococcus sp. T2V TaxID=3034164 RepID=UPI0023E0F26A|nr:magnesium transporter [Rhodococcus sp. T2V]MDF3312760.1 magnesium transporter [Rhodococcus sp. T2V]